MSSALGPSGWSPVGAAGAGAALSPPSGSRIVPVGSVNASGLSPAYAYGLTAEPPLGVGSVLVKCPVDGL
jgi:hypothetical protein